MTRRVFITGIGLTTPLGRGVRECWSHLVAGRSGIGPLTRFDVRAFPVRIGGEVRGDDPEARLRRYPGAESETDRKVMLGLEAADDAVADASIPAEALAGATLHVGVSLETFSIEDAASAEPAGDLVRSLASRFRAERAARLLQTPLDRLADRLGQRFGFGGGRWTNCSACAAGAQAIGEAFRELRDGRGEVALAGAADSILNPLGLGGFSLLHILSPENDKPERACRPFDATRQGTVLAEGAAWVVLESGEHARRRGARIYAEIAGYASTLDAYRVSDPDPTGAGASRCMQRAIADAGLAPADIDGINAHGTGTPKNDAAETRSIKEVFGARAHRLPVTANKSMTGHMIAASGSAEAAFAALTLQARTMPPTINLEHPDPECDLDYVPGRPRAFAGRTVLSNSFGFGGQNATLIFRRLEC